MSIILNLSPATEQKLRERATHKGQSLELFLHDIVEHAAASPNGPVFEDFRTLPSDEALAPFRREVQASGMSDDELMAFFEEIREEIHQEKQQRSGSPS